MSNIFAELGLDDDEDEKEPPREIQVSTPDIHAAEGVEPLPICDIPEDEPEEQLPREMCPAEGDGDVGPLTGTCTAMCPAALLESNRSMAFEFKNGKLDRSLATKAWGRPDAGKSFVPEQLRTPATLLRTCKYLIFDRLSMIGARREKQGAPEFIQFRDAWMYLKDRLWSIQQDFFVQGIVSSWSVQCFEVRARFHLMSQHLLCGHSASMGYDAKANLDIVKDVVGDQLWKQYLAFRERYGSILQAKGPLRNAPEFIAYRLLLNELRHHDDHKKWRESSGNALPWNQRPYGGVARASDHAVRAIANLMPEALETPEVRFALKVLRAYAADNWYRFLELFKEAPYLQACMMSTVLPFVRIAMMSDIWRGTAGNSTLTHEYLREKLMFEDDGDGTSRALHEFLRRHGFPLKSPNLVGSPLLPRGPTTGEHYPKEPDFEPGGEAGSRVRFPWMVVERLRRGKTHAEVCWGIGKEQELKGAPAPRVVKPIQTVPRTPRRSARRKAQRTVTPAVEVVEEPVPAKPVVATTPPQAPVPVESPVAALASFGAAPAGAWGQATPPAAPTPELAPAPPAVPPEVLDGERRAEERRQTEANEETARRRVETEQSSSWRALVGAVEAAVAEEKARKDQRKRELASFYGDQTRLRDALISVTSSGELREVVAKDFLCPPPKRVRVESEEREPAPGLEVLKALRGCGGLGEEAVDCSRMPAGRSQLRLLCACPPEPEDGVGEEVWQLSCIQLWRVLGGGDSHRTVWNAGRSRSVGLRAKSQLCLWRAESPPESGSAAAFCDVVVAPSLAVAERFLEACDVAARTTGLPMCCGAVAVGQVGAKDTGGRIVSVGPGNLSEAIGRLTKQWKVAATALPLWGLLPVLQSPPYIAAQESDGEGNEESAEALCKAVVEWQRAGVDILMDELALAGARVRPDPAAANKLDLAHSSAWLDTSRDGVSPLEVLAPGSLCALRAEWRTPKRRGGGSKPLKALQDAAEGISEPHREAFLRALAACGRPGSRDGGWAVGRHAVLSWYELLAAVLLDTALGSTSLSRVEVLVPADAEELRASVAKRMASLTAQVPQPFFSVLVRLVTPPRELAPVSAPVQPKPPPVSPLPPPSATPTVTPTPGVSQSHPRAVPAAVPPPATPAAPETPPPLYVTPVFMRRPAKPEGAQPKQAAGAPARGRRAGRSRSPRAARATMYDDDVDLRRERADRLLRMIAQAREKMVPPSSHTLLVAK
eukprot:Hpha_TRINITY_DN33461_c0_g1::TRINITY_DN33461_c0_g1_i1::g.729::m.729